MNSHGDDNTPTFGRCAADETQAPPPDDVYSDMSRRYRIEAEIRRARRPLLYGWGREEQEDDEHIDQGYERGF